MSRGVQIHHDPIGRCKWKQGSDGRWLEQNAPGVWWPLLEPSKWQPGGQYAANIEAMLDMSSAPLDMGLALVQRLVRYPDAHWINQDGGRLLWSPERRLFGLQDMPTWRVSPIELERLKCYDIWYPALYPLQGAWEEK